MRRENAWLRIQECVADFREWAYSLPLSTFGYSRVSETTARHLLDSCLCRPVPYKKLLCYKGYAFKENIHGVKHIFVCMMKRIVLSPIYSPLSQGDGDTLSEHDRHRAQGVAPSYRIALIRNTSAVSPSPEASSGSADVELPEPPAQERERCLCTASSVPNFLRARPHYQCVADSCIFVTDRENRLDVHEDRHEDTHSK